MQRWLRCPRLQDKAIGVKHNLFVIAFLLLAVPAGAEKRITVKLRHSPAMAGALGKRVTLGRMSGDCAGEFGRLLLADMHAHGVALDTSDPGASLAPAGVLSINVTRCEAHTLQPILGEGLPAMHISRTEGTFLAMVRAVDPADGREQAAVTVRGHAQKENQSQTTAPEYPAPADVKLLALQQGLVEAQHLYMPWIENREVPFADSKDCHLRQAYDAAKEGDYDASLRLSQANVEACGTAAKVSMEAFYNLGVSYMLLGKCDDAISAFQKASELNGAKLVDGLLEECRRESAAIQARQPKAAPAGQTDRGQTGILLTNDFIIRLVDGNIAESDILKMIANQPCRFSLEPADLAKLKAANVPDAVIAAMRDKK
ncbi:MAG: tetratricopeptide repeat protein [Bryobacteraceae bacterium]